MSAKSILEADGKAILSYHLTRSKPISPSPLPPPPHNSPPKLASLHFPPGCNPSAILDAAETTYPFLLTPGARFVAKPDQLIKRRGKLGLLTLNKPWAEARKWVEERACKEIDVEGVKGILRNFLVEPFVPHKGEEEYYINIHSVREVSCSSNINCSLTSMVVSIFLCRGVTRGWSITGRPGVFINAHSRTNGENTLPPNIRPSNNKVFLLYMRFGFRNERASITKVPLCTCISL